MAMGSVSKGSIPPVEAEIMRGTNPAIPRSEAPIIVVTDASGAAIGGVLMQDQSEGLQPLAFMSKALKPSERRY